MGELFFFFFFFLFINNWSNRTTDTGENVPQTDFLVFIQPVWGFLRKKFQSRIHYLISHGKGYIYFCRPTSHSLKNGHAPPPKKKLFFTVIGKILFFLFFWKKLLYEKYSKPRFLQRSLYSFLLPDTPFPSKWSYPPTNGFSQFFQHKLKNIRKVFPLESILIWNKILWRINSVLIKFLPNPLPFEKLQYECKNSSLLHKVTCITSDHTGAVAKFYIHGFIL